MLIEKIFENNENATIVDESIIINENAFNEVLNSDTEEPRLRNIVKNYDVSDIEYLQGRVAFVKNEKITKLDLFDEESEEEIKKEDMNIFTNSSYTINQFAKILDLPIKEINNNNKTVIIDLIKSEIIKTENDEIIKKLRENNKINYIDKFKALNDTVDNTIEAMNLLKFSNAKNRSIIANYEYYKKINTKENFEKGILKLTNNELYFLEIPLYIVSNETYGEANIPMALIGNFKNSIGMFDRLNQQCIITVRSLIDKSNIQIRILKNMDTELLDKDSYIELRLK